MKLDYSTAAEALAAFYHIDSGVLSALINAESAWNPNAVSKTGATGLGQWTKRTGKDYGIYSDNPPFDNRRDPCLNLTATAAYLHDLYTQNGSYRLAIGHYSGQGPDLANYARYGAGRALIAAIAQADTVQQSKIQAQACTGAQAQAVALFRPS